MTFVLILQICVGLHVHTLFSYYLPIFHELTPEKLNFKEGIALGEVDIFIDGGNTETGYLRKKMYRALSIGVSLILMLPSSGRILFLLSVRHRCEYYCVFLSYEDRRSHSVLPCHLKQRNAQ